MGAEETAEIAREGEDMKTGDEDKKRDKERGRERKVESQRVW